jgi:hypothetical protein
MNWTVVQNNTKTADLESGLFGVEGRKTVRRPKGMSGKAFLSLLVPGTTVDDATLRAFLAAGKRSRKLT